MGSPPDRSWCGSSTSWLSVGHSALVTSDLELQPLSSGDLPEWKPRVRQRLVGQRVSAGWRPADAEALASRVFDRALRDGELDRGQHVCRVVAQDAEVGFVWLMGVDGQDSAHVVCVDVELEVAGSAFEVVAESARELGASRIVISRFDRDEATDAFLAGEDLELMATRMELDLSQEPGREERVRLVPMTRKRFDAFVRHGIEHYARSMYDSGSHTDLSAAREDSRRQHEQLLPRGVESPGHWLWSAYDGDDEVGVLWVNVDGDRAFIYDIEVDEACRRRGYGGAILRAGARASIERGAKVLGLNVFGPNAGARALYEKFGFRAMERVVIVNL